MEAIINFITADIRRTVILAALLMYFIFSIVTYIAYARDKAIAKKNSRRLKQTPRIPESRMHIFEALGGWPGGLIAQRTIRHKNDKRPYMLVFWLITLLHLVGWGVGLYFAYFSNLFG